MKRHVRDPHTRKLRELARLSRKTKPSPRAAARAAFLRAWLGKRGCPLTSTALWLISEGFGLERSRTLKHSLRELRHHRASVPKEKAPN